MPLIHRHRTTLLAAMTLTAAGGLISTLAVPSTAAPAPTTAPTAAPAGPTLDLGKGQTLQLVRVPAGSFTMGSPDDQPDHDASEGPTHVVKFARPFLIGKFEVTQPQYLAVMGFNQAQFKGETDSDRRPEECVSWTDCTKWCEVVSKATGRRVRLPTEAEWEYAARGGDKPAAYGWAGEKLTTAAANFDAKKTVPVGQYPANPFGLCDTTGNVAEWCQDAFHDSYAGAPTDGSAWEAGADPEIRVYRGGSFDNDAANCRCAMRFATERKENRNAHIGFRAVVEDDGK